MAYFYFPHTEHFMHSFRLYDIFQIFVFIEYVFSRREGVRQWGRGLCPRLKPPECRFPSWLFCLQLHTVQRKYTLWVERRRAGGDQGKETAGWPDSPDSAGCVCSSQRQLPVPWRETVETHRGETYGACHNVLQVFLRNHLAIEWFKCSGSDWGTVELFVACYHTLWDISQNPRTIQLFTQCVFFSDSNWGNVSAPWIGGLSWVHQTRG